MTDNAKQALTLIYQLTDGKPYHWHWALTGRAAVGYRQRIMSALTGRKVIQREAGINALTDALRVACDIPHDCTAVETKKIAELAALAGSELL